MNLDTSCIYCAKKETQFLSGKKSNKKASRKEKLIKCPGLDSNQHVLSNTTTSKWLVYQFQHLGSGAANVK